MALPDFFLIGAPGTGVRDLRSLLLRHPEVHLPRAARPGHFLCGDAPPAPRFLRGPGDRQWAHRWLWRADVYERSYARAPVGVVRGDDTPYYLADPAAVVRIHRARPDARIVVLLRDPVERAHVGWLRLRSQGLEPIADFRDACDAEQRRVALGWGPRWRYRGLSRYGEQLEHLRSLFPPDQVLVVRYRELVADTRRMLDSVCRFLGVTPGLVVPPPFVDELVVVPATAASRAVSSAVRAGTMLSTLAPSPAWELAAAPLHAALRIGGSPPPELSVADRIEVLEPLVPDIRRLAHLTGESYDEWFSEVRVSPSAWRSLDAG